MINNKNIGSGSSDNNSSSNSKINEDNDEINIDNYGNNTHSCMIKKEGAGCKYRGSRDCVFKYCLKYECNIWTWSKQE